LDFSGGWDKALETGSVFPNVWMNILLSYRETESPSPMFPAARKASMIGVIQEEIISRD
jgi:hypothetical protein